MVSSKGPTRPWPSVAGVGPRRAGRRAGTLRAPLLLPRQGTCLVYTYVGYSVAILVMLYSYQYKALLPITNYLLLTNCSYHDQGRVEGLIRRSPNELPARLERLLQVLPLRCYMLPLRCYMLHLLCPVYSLYSLCSVYSLWLHYRCTIAALRVYYE